MKAARSSASRLLSRSSTGHGKPPGPVAIDLAGNIDALAPAENVLQREQQQPRRGGKQRADERVANNWRKWLRREAGLSHRRDIGAELALLVGRPRPTTRRASPCRVFPSSPPKRAGNQTGSRKGCSGPRPIAAPSAALSIPAHAAGPGTRTKSGTVPRSSAMMAAPSLATDVRIAGPADVGR